MISRAVNVGGGKVAAMRLTALVLPRGGSKRWLCPISAAAGVTAPSCGRRLRVLASVHGSSLSTKASAAASKEKTIEELYQRKTPVEHVLLRPGMYVGSVESIKETMWLYDAKKERMVSKELEYVPALFKIFDEILVNAADNKMRDPGMKRIDVNINYEDDGHLRVSVMNDGRGITVQKHKEEGVYVPELVFGSLLTGSNFDDEVARLTGGRHGYGAKLTNIFSSEFMVETADSSTGLKFKQVWRNNMQEKDKAEITKLKDGEKDFTRVTFVPDLSRFEIESSHDNTVELMKRRVLDIAGCVQGVTVCLNGEAVKPKNFLEYVNLYRDAMVEKERREKAKGEKSRDIPPPPVHYARLNDRWEVALMPSPNGLQQVTFVNNMFTTRGGSHANYVLDQVAKSLADYINQKHKDLNVTPAHVKAHCCLFVNCLIENPTFDNQMKEFLTSKPHLFGSAAILSSKFRKEVIASSGIVELVVSWAQARQKQNVLKKAPKGKGSLLLIPKLEDANDAGTSKSKDCTLILTEGDSAKAFAVAGLSVIGRDKYGVFPLRGKVLNVRGASLKAVSQNQEIVSLCSIIGLNFNKTYETAKEREELRYGRIMLMTDQDHDGSHIKGLLINFFHTFWPKLLEVDGFLTEFITPIIKAKKGAEVHSFFSIPEFQTWRKEMLESPKGLAGWQIKYYKGLGTSTSAEAREYFGQLDRHRVTFTYSGMEDEDLIDMAFNKTRVTDRKRWLEKYSPDTFLDVSHGTVTYSDFVNKELIQFSSADNERSLPSVIDGLKPSQRKVLFGCFKKNAVKEVKVAQLAGYCAEQTAYNHGEVSLHMTITSMAQDFVGSNNVPLLFPAGQFGTRLQGGKDAARSRYIFTKLGPHTRKVFLESDEKLLKYIEDDGTVVEPEYYVPVIPLLLVNGSDGVGTGWSTSVPPHHPLELIDNLKRMLDGEEPKKMIPWIKGFKGTIREGEKQGVYVTTGICTKKSATELRISELPVGKWTEDFKDFLISLVSKAEVRGFKEYHTEHSVDFVVQLTRQAAQEAEAVGYHKFFKLQKSLSSEQSFCLHYSIIPAGQFLTMKPVTCSQLLTTNMHAFDSTGAIKKYDTVLDILKEFYNVRLEFYENRKKVVEAELAREIRKLQNKVRFAQEISSGMLDITRSGRSKAAVVQLLAAQGYDPADKFSQKTDQDLDNIDQELADGSSSENIAVEQDDKAYDYLLNTPIVAFTMEKVSQLQKEFKTKAAALEKLKTSSPQDLWKEDLERLKESLEKDKDYRRRE